MLYRPMPQYFFIKISKELQKERREKIGSLYLSPTHVYMTRECQAGEIIDIGEGAAQYFPQAKIGDILIIHHFVSGKTDPKKGAFYLIDEDKDYNYYAVTGFSIPGEKNLCYGVWNGKDLIPNQDYIFLEIDKPEAGVEIEIDVQGRKVSLGNQFSVSKSGIIIPHERKQTREELTDKMKKNVERIKQLSNNQQRMTREVVEEIGKLESENNSISKEINAKRYEFFKILAINPEFNEEIDQMEGCEVFVGEQVAMLNIACLTTIEFDKKEFIVAETKYYGGAKKWFKKAIESYKNRAIEV